MKTQIVIANTLKPVDDVRAYEKIAQSIAKTNKYHINIIGNTGKKEPVLPDIEFNVLPLAKRSILYRLWVRLKVLFLFFRMKPEIIIIQTHELLFASILHKFIKKSKIIYDVREDYKMNIRYLSPLPALIRFFLSHFVRIKERLCSLFVDQFWYAEKCYNYEIAFSRSKSVVVENKALKIDEKRKSSESFKCLYSGTISTYGGILLAINAFKEIRKLIPEATFTIIGQCHDHKLLGKLEKIEKENNAIQPIISDLPIAHERIIEQILSSNLGLISYQPNAVNQNKIPTKLYEYSQYGLPYLIQEATPWQEKGKEFGGAIPIDFRNISRSLTLDKLKKTEFLFHSTYPEEATWESQENIINSSLNTLINTIK